MNSEPVLLPPGSGLPGPELWLGHFLFGLMRAGWSRESALRRFGQGGRRILALLQSLDDETGSRRVLVPRLMGLEDSSRHWSPFMIARHLVIVNRDALRIIEALCAGRVPEGEVHMAGLKPAPDTGREAVSDLESILAEFERRVAQFPGWPGAGRHRHPWFGPLNAHGWLCMTAIHHGIHLRQLKRVLKAASPGR